MASTAPVTRMLSSREVAEHLGVSIDAVRRAIRSGALAAYKPCGRVRIREEDLVAYLDEQRISGVRRGRAFREKQEALDFANEVYRRRRLGVDVSFDRGTERLADWAVYVWDTY